MPANVQLDINETFESQKKMVTQTIIPALFKVLDQPLIGEGVLYEILHQRHRHQREELMMKQKDNTEQVKEKMRRHGNSRRNEVIY